MPLSDVQRMPDIPTPVVIEGMKKGKAERANIPNPKLLTAWITLPKKHVIKNRTIIVGISCSFSYYRSNCVLLLSFIIVDYTRNLQLIATTTVIATRHHAISDFS